MQKEINLLPKKNIGILQQERTIAIVRAVAILSCVVFVTSWIGIFLLGKNYSVEAVTNQQNAVEARLASLNKKTISYLTLHDRVTRIQTILRTRSLLTGKIDTLEKQIPSDVDLQSISVSQKTASISVSSTSLSSLKSFLDSLTALYRKKSIFSTLIINNVLVNAKTGAYTVTVNGNLL